MINSKKALASTKGRHIPPFLSIMLVDTISQEVCLRSPWELLYADDLAINDTTVMGAQKRLWNNALADSDLKINVAKQNI